MGESLRHHRIQIQRRGWFLPLGIMHAGELRLAGKGFEGAALTEGGLVTVES
jgi:hypothetical protein